MTTRDQRTERRAPVDSRATARSAPNRPASVSRGTDDFERMMRSNTVVVRGGASAQRRKSPLPGKIALGLAIVSAAVDASAFAVFMGGDQRFALGICFAVVFLTFVAAVLGFIAAVGSFGRWYGVFGVLVAFIANPVILIVILLFVAPGVASNFGV